ncbi:unnamed protein product [Ceutorhynchus assimilis]|uniref:Uncharacterized protein n=1 Tax=Ceutorhynchus assimilis TaxID=467358 RepID=A0A9N9N3P8_9CUCU|nr:unnamed protein product [Ceutorhynchus assimilis]
MQKCPCKFKPVTHVIFDMDGIIFDTEPIYEEAFIKTLVAYGIEPDYDLYATVCGTPSPKVAEITLKKYRNLKTTHNEFIEEYRQHAKLGFKNLNLIPGVEKMIKHLHSNNIPLAIATSSSQESALQKLQRFPQIYQLFKHIVYGNDPEIKHGKPAPDSYLLCAAKFPVNPSKCLVFEDSTNGMQAALAAGMQVVLIPNETVPKEQWAKATLKVECFDDVRPELFGLPPVQI